MKLAKTPRTTVKRMPKRAAYEHDKIVAVIQEAIIGHMAFTSESGVHSIPLPFWHDNGYIYCHFSIQSRLKNLGVEKQDVSISFTILDGLVLAKSALHHSMNYRSVVVYGQCEPVIENAEKFQQLKQFMDVIAPERWQDIRQPNHKELNATAMLKLPLTEAVIKQRVGIAEEKKSDLTRKVWAGIIPIKQIKEVGIEGY